MEDKDGQSNWIPLTMDPYCARMFERVDPRTVPWSGEVWFVETEDNLDEIFDFSTENDDKIGTMLGTKHDAILFSGSKGEHSYVAFLWTDQTPSALIALMTEFIESHAKEPCDGPEIRQGFLNAAYEQWVQDFEDWLRQRP